MSPFPAEPARALGPMRFVLSAYPSREAALEAVEGGLSRRLIACASLVPVESRYWWNDRIETAGETLVLFKTVPKRVGALFRYLKDTHPYHVPEIAEVDVPRVDRDFVAYLSRTVDRAALDIPPWGHARRPGVRRDRGAPSPGRTRGRHRPP
jgi:periplasmic divalent cation tolerance protein